jgi:hypothetical protein
VKKHHLLLVFVGLIVSAIVWMIVVNPVEEISPSELRNRVIATKTDWANYQEDLKGQIGSTPVARWQGDLVQSRVLDRVVEIDFKVRGFWSQTDVNLPLLIRGPLGKTYSDTSSFRKGDIVTYSFRIESGTSQLSWIELKYPHATRRIAYTNGLWDATVQ